MRNIVKEIWNHGRKRGIFMHPSNAEEEAMARVLEGYDGPQDALDSVFELDPNQVVGHTAEGFPVRVDDVRWAARRRLDQN